MKKTLAILAAITALVVWQAAPASAWYITLSSSVSCVNGTSTATIVFDNTSEPEPAIVQKSSHPSIIAVGTEIPKRGKLTRTAPTPLTLEVGVSWKSDTKLRTYTTTAKGIECKPPTTTTVPKTTTTFKPTTTTSTVKPTTTTIVATTTSTSVPSTTTSVAPTTTSLPPLTTSTVPPSTTEPPKSTTPSSTVPSSSTSISLAPPTTVTTASPPELAKTGFDIASWVVIGGSLLFLGLLLTFRSNHREN